MTWRIEIFTPSDGRKVGGVTVDHQAWLERRLGAGRATYISLNIASHGVSTEEAKTMLDVMVAALNQNEECRTSPSVGEK